ncbi:FHA domain protein [Amphritea atlantica]|uniref:FHA domain protein n=1 Tax=Amphritea atlantica TaxID=355243 RepID=A0A1H9M8L8_9GAMM|nr:type VI secretion system-associated FHA domain protein TagH [Amphritea atlantica]SER19799.1 FHA domain protein [Amphritea atlantica]
MKIKVTLIAFRGIAPARKVEKIFSGEDFTIGRADDNEIVLEDPDRYCSRYHARCYQISGSYYLEDTSSPGTQLNSGQFITRGQRHKFQDGDRLIIGENQLLVTVEEDEPEHPQQVSIDSFSIDDFFAETETDFVESSAASRVAPLPNIPLGNTADYYRAQKHQYEADAVDQHPFDFSDLSPHGTDSSEVTPPVSELLAVANDVSEASETLQSPGCDSGSDSLTKQPQNALLTGREESVATVEQDQTAELHIDSRAMRAFLDGLGLKPEDLIGRNKVEIMHSAGEMLNILTKGTMEILQTRNEIKREFGMDVTRIGAVRNNPLKFCQRVEEAMLIMLTHSEGYLGPQESVSEGVVDVKAHQVAVMSGMQAALTALLKRFEPTALESQLNVRFTLSKKSRYWDMYTTAYQQLQLEAQDNFHGLFGEEFSRVYEEQVRQINKVL